MIWDRSTAHSRPFSIQIHDLKHYCHPNSPLIFWTVTANQRIPKKFSTIRSQVLGPIKRPLTASNQPKHGKTLKNGNKTQVGRKSYSWSLSKLANHGSTRSLLRVERFPFLLRRNPMVRLRDNLERRRFFSL